MTFLPFLKRLQALHGYTISLQGSCPCLAVQDMRR